MTGRSNFASSRKVEIQLGKFEDYRQDEPSDGPKSRVGR